MFESVRYLYSVTDEELEIATSAIEEHRAERAESAKQEARNAEIKKLAETKLTIDKIIHPDIVKRIEESPAQLAYQMFQFGMSYGWVVKYEGGEWAILVHVLQ
jgi:hypothetical protein